MLPNNITLYLSSSISGYSKRSHSRTYKKRNMVVSRSKSSYSICKIDPTANKDGAFSLSRGNFTVSISISGN